MISMDRLPPVPSMNPSLGMKEITHGTDQGKTSTFGDELKKFVGDVNDMQLNASDKTMKFATGEIKDLHEVMAATEEAGISLMLLMEIRNKAVDAYKELIRTPV